MRKDLARYMIRGRTRADKGQEKKTWSPHDVTRPLDTWDPATPELVQLKDKEPDVPESRPWGRTGEMSAEVEPQPKPKPARVLGKKRTVRLSITVSEEEEDIIKTYDLHANCYIQKPVDLAQFLDVVKSIESFWLTIVQLPNGTH